MNRKNLSILEFIFESKFLIVNLFYFLIVINKCKKLGNSSPLKLIYSLRK